MSKPVFYDPQRKRWKRLRRIFDLLALFGGIIGIVFVIGLVRFRPMRGLDLRSATKRYRALSAPPAVEVRTKERLNRSIHRKTDLKPSDVVLNTNEGLRAAFYTDVDPASYASPLPVGSGDGAQLVFLTGSHLRALSAAGKELWKVPFKDRLNDR